MLTAKFKTAITIYIRTAISTCRVIQAVINDNLVNSGNVTVNGAGVTLVVDGNVNNSGALLLQNGGKIDPALTTSSAGTIGGTGTIVGPVKVTGRDRDRR